MTLSLTKVYFYYVFEWVDVHVIVLITCCHTVSQDSELRGRQHPFKGTIVSDYGDLMLTKSTGIKNICRGKLGFLKFSAFYKGKHTLDQSDWAAVYKEKTVPRRMFLISMDSYKKILLVLGTIVRLEGCCRPLSSESQDTLLQIDYQEQCQTVPPCSSQLGRPAFGPS